MLIGLQSHHIPTGHAQGFRILPGKDDRASGHAEHVSVFCVVAQQLDSDRTGSILLELSVKYVRHLEIVSKHNCYVTRPKIFVRFQTSVQGVKFR